jgi:hypothetical protein
VAALADLREPRGRESPNPARFVRRRVTVLAGIAALATLVAGAGARQLLPDDIPALWRLGLGAAGVVVVVAIPASLLVTTVAHARRHVRWEVTERALHVERIGPRRGERLVRPLASIAGARLDRPLGSRTLGIATLVIGDLELHHLDAAEATHALAQIQAAMPNEVSGRLSPDERDEQAAANGLWRLRSEELYRVRPGWFGYYIFRLGPHATFLYVVIGVALIALFG